MLLAIEQQRPEISNGVHMEWALEDLDAGDQIPTTSPPSLCGPLCPVLPARSSSLFSERDSNL